MSKMCCRRLKRAFERKKSCFIRGVPIIVVVFWVYIGVLLLHVYGNDYIATVSCRVLRIVDWGFVLALVSRSWDF